MLENAAARPKTEATTIRTSSAGSTAQRPRRMRVELPARSLAGAFVAGLVLAACGGGGSQTVVSTAGSGSEAAPPAAATSAAAQGDGQSAVKLVQAGFGQRDEYVWVTSIVEATGDDAVGKFVTVQFNVLDKSGEILGSTEQVEALTAKGQKVALGTQVDLPSSKVKAAKVEATVVVGNDAGDLPADFQVTATKVKIGKDEYGDVTATFQLANAGEAPAKDTRVGVVCMNKAGDIIGGTAEYPEVIPAKGRIRVDASVITTGVPATCEVYPGPGF